MIRALSILALLALLGSAQAETFTYRGTLEDGGVPAEGAYDLQLRLYADAKGKHALSAPIELHDVAIVDGRFAVSVDVTGLPPHLDSGWLEVAVKSADDGGYWPLPERSQVLLKGATCPASWALAGNSGTDPDANFLGTTETATPLLLRAGNMRVAEFRRTEGLGSPGSINVVLGAVANEVPAGVRGATISGGGANSNPNRVTGPFGTVSGGLSNISESSSSTVGGGNNNIASGGASTVGGGNGNHATGAQATVGGGQFNRAIGERSFVSGGSSNRATGGSSSVLGGQNNFSEGAHSTVTGGLNNCAGGDFSWAGGRGAKVRPAEEPTTGPCVGLDAYPGEAGDRGTFVWSDDSAGPSGRFVSTGPNQFLVRATGGVGLNTNAPEAQLHVQRSSAFSDVALFAHTAAATVRIASGVGSSSILAFSDSDGTRAQITAFDTGTFTLRSEGAIQLRTGGNTTRFQITDNGGVSIRRGPGGPDADKAIQVGTNTSTGNGAHLTNTGVWTNASSRSFKHAFEAVDTGAILDRLLALPVQHWSYRGNDTVRHLGPTAEDFRAAFGLGHDERYIGAVDADGVALAAIQGLNAKLEVENSKLLERTERLETEVAALRAAVADLIQQGR